MKTDIKQETPILTWDTSDIAESQVKFLRELAKEEGEEFDEEAALQSAWADDFIYNDHRDYMYEYLTEIMAEIQKESGFDGEDWSASVENFGWRSVSGSKMITGVSEGGELLSNILPDTECTFKIYRRGNMLVINNAHHDSPVWKEFYYITPSKCCDFCDDEAIASTVEHGEAVCDYHLEEETYKHDAIQATCDKLNRSV